MLKIIIPIVVVIVLLIAFFKAFYVIASPNQALVISGFKKEPRFIVGKAGLKLPVLEKLNKLSLANMQVDIKTEESVPTEEFINIYIDAVATFKISSDPKYLSIAAEALLGKSEEEIKEMVSQTLLGSTREVVGLIGVVDLNNKQMISQKVMENVTDELLKIGIEVTNFNIQNFRDENGILENLGIDNTEKIRKNAAIAKAEAEKETAIARALAEKETLIAKSKAAQEANEIRIKAETEIAESNNRLAIRKAELKAIEEQQQAKTDAAKQIEDEAQRREIEIKKQDANIAMQEKEAVLAEKTVAVQEKKYAAEINKKADADRYAAEQQAQADLAVKRANADAKIYEAQKEAEAIKIKGLAEAEAIEKKADAMQKYGEAAILQMVLEKMPEIVENASKPLQNVDSITMYGDGNGSKLVGDVMKTVNQVMAGLKSNGIDVNDIINKSLEKKSLKSAVVDNVIDSDITENLSEIE